MHARTRDTCNVLQGIPTHMGDGTAVAKRFRAKLLRKQRKHIRTHFPSECVRCVRACVRACVLVCFYSSVGVVTAVGEAVVCRRFCSCVVVVVVIVIVVVVVVVVIGL